MYQKNYYLEKVKAVNEVYVEYHAKGYTNEYIYKQHIAKRFFISRSTFYSYLSVPYKKMLLNNP